MRASSVLSPRLLVPLLLLFLLFLLSSSAAPTDDEVLSLPGWQGPLPSRHFSGYLRIAGGTNLHYYFVASERVPQTAPTVVWLNGGPGCSSLDGWTCVPPYPPTLHSPLSNIIHLSPSFPSNVPHPTPSLPLNVLRRYEMGPFIVELNGNDTSLVPRPFRWNRIVNML